MGVTILSSEFWKTVLNFVLAGNYMHNCLLFNKRLIFVKAGLK